MDKEYIIAEIKRTASENKGKPLGQERFENVTNIKKSAWWGKIWRTWGDAVEEAGFQRNVMQKSYDHSYLIAQLATLTRKNRRFPSSVDLRLEKKENPIFPSHTAFNGVGTQKERIEAVRSFSLRNREYSDILSLLPVASEKSDAIQQAVEEYKKNKDQFVYLAMLKIDTKKRYKIGKTNLVERRSNELSIQLPEKLELVHRIETDDMSGIESYWHKRFADKNTNGEWFDLTAEDVRAFKRRKFM